MKNNTAATASNIVHTGSGNRNPADSESYGNKLKQQSDYEYVTEFTNNNRSPSYITEDRNLTSLESGPTNRPSSYRPEDRNVTSLESGPTNRPFSYTPEDPTMASIRSLSSLKKGPTSSTAIPRVNLHSPTTEPYYMECLEPNPRSYTPSVPADNAQRLQSALVSKQQSEPPSNQKTKSDSGMKKAPNIHQMDSNRLPNRSQPSAMGTDR
jgi:hypothetical protein